MGTTEATPREIERQKRARQSLLLLSRRIREARERRGLTQEEFAVRCGISVSFASLLERGERSPSYETLVDVAETLEMSLSALLGDSPEKVAQDPYLARLTDFAQAARLTHAQVDRLVAVGHAMFGLEFSRAQRTISLPRGKGCSQENCLRPVLAKGLCASHYHQRRRERVNG